MPVNLFGAVMSMAGLALAWRLAHASLGAPAVVGEGIGVFSLGLATQEGLLTQFSTVAEHELPDDYLETYRAKVRAVTPEELLATARKYLDSENMQIVLAGDRSQIESQAVLFGEVELFDAQGNRL